MSKPEPIIYELESWEIRYSKGTETLPNKYKTKIVWTARVSYLNNSRSSEVLGSRDDKSFETFDEAKVYIDKNVDELS